jgi:Myb-like DNA-binding domain
MKLVARFGAHKWNDIAREISRELFAKNNKLFVVRTGKQVRERYHNYLETNYNFDPITGREAFIIFERFKQVGKKWAQICRELDNRRSENTIKNFYYTIQRIFKQHSENILSMYRLEITAIVNRLLASSGTF